MGLSQVKNPYQFKPSFGKLARHRPVFGRVQRRRENGLLVLHNHWTCTKYGRPMLRIIMNYIIVCHSSSYNMILPLYRVRASQFRPTTVPPPSLPSTSRLASGWQHRTTLLAWAPGIYALTYPGSWLILDIGGVKACKSRGGGSAMIISSS